CAAASRARAPRTLSADRALWRSPRESNVAGILATGTLGARRVPSALPPTPPPRVKRWLREPLLHFLLAGLALFLVSRRLNPSPVERDASNQIKLTEDDLRRLTTAWVAQGRPSPTPEQMRTLVEAKVREEVLYREALALGLDRNESVVKRRLP